MGTKIVTRWQNIPESDDIPRVAVYTSHREMSHADCGGYNISGQLMLALRLGLPSHRVPLSCKPKKTRPREISLGIPASRSDFTFGLYMARLIPPDREHSKSHSNQKYNFFIMSLIKLKKA
jgi:hypothetical protein